jgi:hypothetical protein
MKIMTPGAISQSTNKRHIRNVPERRQTHLRPRRSKPQITLTDDVDDLAAGRSVSRKFLSNLIEQSCSARILVKRQSVDLAQES